jgi:hypothetical protein
LKRRSALLAAAALATLLLAGCAQQSGLDLARQACDHVHTSLAAYQEGLHATTSSEMNRDFAKALAELQVAEPLAAAATSANGQWNALMTTLNEAGQVDEAHLLVALKAQCAVADSKESELPNNPTTFPPTPNSP